MHHLFLLILFNLGGRLVWRLSVQTRPEMKGKSMISKLRLKFAGKSWNDTFQLVRRCMEKTRDESNPVSRWFDRWSGSRMSLTCRL
ncbi:unnamed protein product [Pleuronectes platessa]|uniref:Secreted protein n=1 Tax=Pleuronectes platessa TaxID=8262 RepID=A0A9N7VK81_PLEPL|nr:unnamed protein product [Pleuronectes platessa]